MAKDWLRTMVESIENEFKRVTGKDLPFMSSTDIGKSLFWADHKIGTPTLNGPVVEE